MLEMAKKAQLHRPWSCPIHQRSGKAQGLAQKNRNSSTYHAG